MSYDLIYSYKKVQVDNQKVHQFFEKKKVKYMEIKSYKNNEFIGIIEIPKINMKRGFVNPYSNHNNIRENIEILKPFMMPNEKNSTFILAAHSGNSHISYFKDLYKLEINDTVYVYFNNKKYEYRIAKYYEEEKNGNITIHDSSDNKKLVLTTCKSFNKQLIYIAYLSKAI